MSHNVLSCVTYCCVSQAWTVIRHVVGNSTNVSLSNRLALSAVVTEVSDEELHRGQRPLPQNQGRTCTRGCSVMASERSQELSTVAADVRGRRERDVCFESSVTMQWDYFRLWTTLKWSQTTERKKSWIKKYHIVLDFLQKSTNWGNLWSRQSH